MNKGLKTPLAALLTVLAALLGATTGCDTLPPGTPPPGAIADNTPPPAESGRALHNRLVTELVMFSVQNGLRELAAAPGDALAEAVAHDAAHVAGFTIRPAAPARLHSSADAKELVLSSADGRILWQSGSPK